KPRYTRASAEGWSKNRQKMFPAGRWGHDFAGIFTPAAGNAIFAPTPNPKIKALRNIATGSHPNQKILADFF
ncbi:MAG: hypothetical protein ACUVQQ_13995, partial [Thermogutta sp.]